MIESPVILFPITNWTATGSYTYSSSAPVQVISGDIPLVPAEIEPNTTLLIQYRYRIENSSGPGSFTAFSYSGVTVGTVVASASSVPWSFNSENVIDTAIGDILHFEFKTVRISSFYGEVGPILEQSSVVPLIVNIVAEYDIKASANPVTGVKLKRYTDHIKVMVPSAGITLNTNTEFAGCNFYMSLTAGGGSSGYVLMNDVLITNVDDSETEEITVEDSSYTDTTNDLEIQTIKTHQFSNTYYTFSINKSVIASMVQAGKIPNIFLSDGQTLSEDVVYYFVETVTVFDKSFNETVESTYSIELEAAFLRYTTNFRNLPKRNRSDILFSISRDAMLNNSAINVIPGSVIRDILDPVALEFEKFYVIQDFIFATLSLDTLLAYDDQDGDGISDPVSLNASKSALMNALGITDPINLQLLIDQQFDKWGANFNLVRKKSSNSIGTALFFTEIRPSQNILIPDGTVIASKADLDQSVSSISFSTNGSQIIDTSSLDHYYNPTMKRYEILANIKAQLPGSSGNVPAGTITVSKSLIPTIQVTNNAPTQYGTDRESNLDLANRIKIAKISFDSGTEGGYAATAYDVPGVLQARIQKAGDPLMVRDYDTLSKKHIGGKVDVYIKGTNVVQFVDQVAFNYEYPTDTYGNKIGEQFSVINASEYMFRAKNPKVNSESPIVSVSRIRNVTRSKDYSIVGMQIAGDGNVVILDKNFDNLNIGIATMDVVEVNYLYRSSNSIVLASQPVESLVSVVSSSGVVVDSSKYKLVKMEDPLQNGRSSIAQDAVKFFFNENDNIPYFVPITGEDHNMLLDTPARLLLKGVDISTIVVYPEGGSGTPYLKDIDYSVVNGSESAYTYLNLLNNSKIRHGDTVTVNYNASENFSITYVHNGLVDQVQAKIEKMHHSCADVIVKVAVENFADISFRVVKKTGVDSSLLKSRLQTSVANYMAGLKMGMGFSQGTLVSIIQKVPGVSEIKLPLIRMMKRNSSFIPLDDLGTLAFEVYQRTSGNGITSYRTVNSVLTYRTSNGGGDSNLFRGVYENNILLTMTSSVGEVSKAAGQAYILSDGRLIVSTTDGAPPQSKHYKASYYTYYPADANPVEDLTTSEIEYLNIDSLSMKDIDVIDEKVTKRGL
jgi:hypothetical protein